MNRVVIIGAGLGGLATAIRLAHEGFSVTLLEKNGRVGGKMDIVHAKGYVFDTGPSLLTMPFVVCDLFEAVGRKLEDYIDLVPVDPICRYFFRDNSFIDATTDMQSMKRIVAAVSPQDVAGFKKFIDHGRKIYDASAEPFLFQPFGSLNLNALLKNIKHLPAIAKLDAFRTLNEAVESFVIHPHLRQLFNRFATYNGSSPYHAPATLAIIPFIEFSFGGWYIKGGMYKLAQALETLANELGVQIRTQSEVKEILVERGTVRGVRLASNEIIFADMVVSNADALYAYEQLMPLPEKSFERVEPSLGGFVLLLGVRKTFAQLKHHNIFFSDNYKAEFDAMFNDRSPADDPSIYVSNTSATDAAHAPEGSSNLFVLVNAPSLAMTGTNGQRRYDFDWRSEKVKYRNLVIENLEALGLTDLKANIEYEEILTPLDFEGKYNAFRGSIYGTSSNNRMAAFLRPPNKAKNVEGLYFVGGSSHPGGGIPLVLLSGKIVSDLIRQEVGVL